MLLSKLKEIMICLKAGRVTLPYPFVRGTLPPGFRGQPAIDGEKCLGCGACAQVCPPRLITVTDTGETRQIEVDYSRCTYCARCAEICPVQAMTLTDQFELATGDKEELKLTVELNLMKCSRCGTPFITRRMFNKLADGFSPEWLSEKKQLPEWLSWCPSCRKEQEGCSLKEGCRHA